MVDDWSNRAIILHNERRLSGEAGNVTAIVQMQHMPISFTTEFADNADNISLNGTCRIARAARRKGPNLGVPMGVDLKGGR